MSILTALDAVVAGAGDLGRRTPLADEVAKGPDLSAQALAAVSKSADSSDAGRRVASPRDMLKNVLVKRDEATEPLIAQLLLEADLASAVNAAVIDAARPGVA